MALYKFALLLLLPALLFVASGVGRKLAHSIGEDRAADREADVPVDAGACPQPIFDTFDGCATAEDETSDSISSVTAGGASDRATGIAIVYPLDLPEARLDARILQRLDRALHQLRPQLRVIAVATSVD